MTRVVSKLVVEHEPRSCDQPGPLQFTIREPLIVEIDGTLFRAPSGANTDGASTPRIFRNLVPRVGRHIYGAIIHDAAYRGVLEVEAAPGAWTYANRSRKWADEVFFQLMETTYTGLFTRWMAYAAVRLFGSWSFKGIN